MLISTAYGIRRRLANGATVEQSQSYRLECEDYDADEVAEALAMPVNSTFTYGVNIYSSAGDGKIPGPEQACRESELLGYLLTAYRNFGGCTTPAEEFVVDVVRHYGCSKKALTPNAVAGHVETFRDNFKDAIEDARRMLKQYADLVNPEESADAA